MSLENGRVHCNLMTELSQITENLVLGRDLNRAEARQAMEFLISDGPDALKAAILTALRCKGATSTELIGLCDPLLASLKPYDVEPDTLLDTCGTGGGIPSFNLSTAAAIIAAACGVRISKHGNRAVTSKCGSADVLEALSVAIHGDPIEQLSQQGITFLFAPEHHHSLKVVGPLRRSLGFRTVFNQLGPLLNPLRAKRQVIGVYDESLLRPMAEAALGLGAHEVWLVRGVDGLDEVTPVAETRVIVRNERAIEERIVSPKDFGLEPLDPKWIEPGETVADSANILKESISDVGSPRFLAVLPSAATALVVAQLTPSLMDAAELVRNCVASGVAARKLEEMRQQ